jgi:serine/threonine protein kinase
MSGIESLLTGRVLSERYRIEEVIGRGGMGAVYRATDERLGRQVAVKVITVSGGSDPDARERLRARFHREARSAAALPHHPNVVPVYDYGTDPTLGLDFLVMELLRGEDLATLLGRSGPPPLPTAIWILHQAARGVAVGHRSGLIHRDIKPGNIFLARGNHPDDIEVRVLDFGIAKLMAEDDSLSNLTQDGRVPLSPAYASPEQLRGLTQLSPAADVFSLGAVGYQLLTGERPFTESDRNRMSIGMPADPTPVRARNPSVPPAVGEIVQRALAYDATERWPDAAALASVLEQARREMGDVPLAPYAPVSPAPAVPAPVAAAGSTPSTADDRTEFMDDRTLLDPRARTVAPPPAASPPAPAPRRRDREGRGGGWFVTALILLLLVGAGGVFAWFIAENSDGAVEEPQSSELPEVPPITPDVTVDEPEQPSELDAVINNQEGLRFYRQGDFTTALEQFRRAVEISPDNPEYRYNYGLTLLRLGVPDEAANVLQRVTQQDPGRPGAYYYLAEAYRTLGDTTAAISALERVLQLSTDPRQRGVAERQLRDLRAAQQPLPFPDTLPPPEVSTPADTAAVPGMRG